MSAATGPPAFSPWGARSTPASGYSDFTGSDKSLLVTPECRGATGAMNVSGSVRGVCLPWASPEEAGEPGRWEKAVGFAPQPLLCRTLSL